MNLEIIKKIKSLHERLNVLSKEIGVYSNNELFETLISHRDEISNLAMNLSNLSDFIHRVYTKEETR